MKQKINSWADITVGQFMDLQTLAQNKNRDDLEKAEDAISILYNLTPQQIDELSVIEFNAMAKHCVNIMTKEITGKPQRIIKANGKRYEIIYNPKDLRHRQFVEIQHFVQNMVPNIHNIMASIVIPIGKFGKRIKNVSEMHDEIANDMLDAKITDVYNSCVFFCKLWLNSLVHTRAYLVHEMMKKGTTKEQAMTLTGNSIDAMAGFLTQKDWLILNV